MSSIELTDRELLALDGVCRPETQAKVDAAKERVAAMANCPELPDNIADFVGSIVEEANKNGKLIYSGTNVSFCRVCKKSAGYAKHTRNGKYHRKGDDNWKRPLTMRAVELAESCVRFQNHATLGCCIECWERSKEYVAIALRDVKAEMPSALTGVSRRYKKHDLMQCECGWRGKESEMGRLPVLIGHGTYAGVCPACGTRNELFSSHIKPTGEWVVEIETEPTQ